MFHGLQIKGKSVLRAAFYRGRLWMPHILSNMMLFFIQLAFKANFWPFSFSSIKVPAFSIKFYTFFNFELNKGRVFETPVLKLKVKAPCKVKNRHKKLSSVVNFINVLRAHFLYKILVSKITKLKCN